MKYKLGKFVFRGTICLNKGNPILRNNSRKRISNNWFQMQLLICINKANGTKVGQGEQKDLYNSSGQGEEKDGQDRFRLERREGWIEQIQVSEKRRMDRTGSGQETEKEGLDGFSLRGREGSSPSVKCERVSRMVLIALVLNKICFNWSGQAMRL